MSTIRDNLLVEWTRSVRVWHHPDMAHLVVIIIDERAE